MSKQKSRVEYVDRIIESLDRAANRKGQPKQRFTFTREQFREHLMTAYNNGAVEKYLHCKRVLELMDWRAS